MEQTLSKFQPPKNETVADLHTGWTVLCEKCIYNQYFMNTHKVDLFIHTVKYSAFCSWAREQWADLAYDRLLDKYKSQETAMAEDLHDKENKQDCMDVPATDSMSLDTACISEGYRRVSFQDLLQMWPCPCYLSCYPAFDIQCGKCGHSNHWECMCHPRTTSRSLSRRAENGGSGIRHQSRYWHRGARNQSQSQKGQKNTCNNNQAKPKLQQQQMYTFSSLLKAMHLDAEEFLCKSLEKFTGMTPPGWIKTETKGTYRHW